MITNPIDLFLCGIDRPNHKPCSGLNINNKRMNETTEAAPRTVTITRENAREVFMDAVANILRTEGGRNEQESLLEILRNNDCRDIFAACVNEASVVRAFTRASSKNDVELLQAFYDIGVNVDAKDRNGDIALSNASSDGRVECVRWLLDHGANVEILDNGGSTALICATINGRLAVVEMLLQQNANPDIQNKNDYTALMCASNFCHKEIVQLLLNYNANTDLKNFQGETALDLAKNKETKKMLLNHVNTSYVLK